MHNANNAKIWAPSSVVRASLVLSPTPQQNQVWTALDWADEEQKAGRGQEMAALGPGSTERWKSSHSASRQKSWSPALSEAGAVFCRCLLQCKAEKFEEAFNSAKSGNLSEPPFCSEF